MLTAEVIAIGDEMTTGARVDTNSAWLSRQLASLGIRTVAQTTVPDDLAVGAAAIRAAAGRADVIVATGGLGPTRDDLTRDVLAEVTGGALEFRREVMDTIEALFAARSRPLPPRNRIQAMFPAGAAVIPNPQGTAPGIEVEVAAGEGAAARVFALPGVPAEMRQMFLATVRPQLLERLGAGRRTIRQHVVKCFGLGESEMESRLGEMIARNRQPSVGITVSRATISLRITAEAASEAEALELIEATRREIYAAVPETIFGEGESTELQHAVAECLARRGQTLWTLELGAACPISGWMAATDVSQRVYRGGMFAPELDSLPALAAAAAAEDVAADRLPQWTGCSGADWGLMVDRYPQIPDSDAPLPAFPVTFTLWRRADQMVRRQEVQLGGHPDIIPDRIAKAGLNFLRQTMLVDG
ncbi:competence/damage-inducible protein A [Roseimaritima sediminicola]|uniref:competence/damage-inducible protein A n=1 Tax=Roseimaritima sediminicola TaxID=2662066 RepID=UPI001298376B|nr:molybdopterin-binding protein [Roseimaritima sediminicola]